MSVLTILCYLCLGVFFVAVIARAMKILSLPLHLRWELYPVAHEPAGKVKYGGSFMEDPEYWNKPRTASKLGELKVMAPEILLLEGVRHHNLSQWFRTWPFHMGLYLLVTTTVLMVVGGLLGQTAPGGFFGTLIPILGYAGLGLGLLGAVALLLRRVLEADYREYAKPADYFNLVLFVAALGVALLAQLTADPAFVQMRTFFAGLFTFEPVALGVLQTAEVVLFAVLVAYVPLTHMSHFFTKYFMYHDVRWSDEPMNEALEKKVASSLGLKPTWAARHVGADGEKTWAEVATADVNEIMKDGE